MARTLVTRSALARSSVRCDRGLVPRGVSHTFGNAGAETARVLVLHAPALDAYFVGLHELWNRDEPPTPDEERALMAQFGMTTGGG